VVPYWFVPLPRAPRRLYPRPSPRPPLRALLGALPAVAAAAALAGCQPAGLASSTSATSPTGTAATGTAATGTGTAGRPAGATSAPAGCRSVPAPRPRTGEEHIPPPPAGLRLDPSRTYTVTVATNCGSFTFTLDVRRAPRIAASFYYLVRRGFYDDLTFHRVVPGFVIQGGDPAGNGTGGPGYTVIERPPSRMQYLRGTVAMAKTQSQPPGAAGSQFFIVTAANATRSAGLTAVYALLGHVVSGMKVVQRIDALPTDPAGTPRPVVVMERVTVS
jgi:cyclophilin family peptidyl-prolyl cis-trans isomerase